MTNEFNDDLIDNLNEVQRQVVCNKPCNMLVVAGAGTGKTRVLVLRVLWLIKHLNVKSSSVLCVTFTNKAAKEMQGRIASSVGPRADFIWSGTFHSVCLRLLRIYSKQAGLADNFTILDSGGQHQLVKRIMTSMNLPLKEIKPSEVADEISKLKEKGFRTVQTALYGQNDKLGRCVAQVFPEYERICRESGAVDFSELILRTVEMLEGNQSVKEALNRRFAEILVDEFQDTNSLQYRFLKAVTGASSHVMAVGDDDQSIYGWRGANIGNMKKFKEDFDDVKQFALEENYRSCQNILDVANNIISVNENRLADKVLYSQKGQGDSVRILNCPTGLSEADNVVREILRLHREGEPLESMAVLYRNNSLSLQFENILARKGIRYIVYGGLKFYDRAEIQDALAYLRLIVNADDDTAFLRIINVPSRKIGPKVLEKLAMIASERRSSLLKAVKLLKIYSEDPDASKEIKSLAAKFSGFLEIINELSQLKHKLNLPDFITKVIMRSGLYDFYKARDEKDNKTGFENQRHKNLEELVSNAKSFEDEASKALIYARQDDEDDLLGDFKERDLLLDYISNTSLSASAELDQSGSAGKAGGALNLMTIHASKGLEFKTVFLVCFEENIIPSSRAYDPFLETILDQERFDEEVRLAYVGVTRAKSRLYISYARSRMIFGKDSRTKASLFLYDLVKKSKQMKNCPFKIVKCGY